MCNGDVLSCLPVLYKLTCMRQNNKILNWSSKKIRMIYFHRLDIWESIVCQRSPLHDLSETCGCCAVWRSGAHRTAIIGCRSRRMLSTQLCIYQYRLPSRPHSHSLQLLCNSHQSKLNKIILIFIRCCYLLEFIYLSRFAHDHSGVWCEAFRSINNGFYFGVSRRRHSLDERIEQRILKEI